MEPHSFTFDLVHIAPGSIIVVHAEPEFWSSIAEACKECDDPAILGVPVIMLQPGETLEVKTVQDFLPQYLKHYEQQHKESLEASKISRPEAAR